MTISKKSTARRAAPRKAPAKAPEPTPTEDAGEEYLSLIHTVEPLETSASGMRHVVQKMVASTEDLIEALLSLFTYYGEEHILHNRSTLEQIQLAAQVEHPAFIYRTPENVQIVSAMDTYDALVAFKGTLLGASQHLLDIAGQAISDAEQARGGPVPLILVSISSQDD